MSKGEEGSSAPIRIREETTMRERGGGKARGAQRPWAPPRPRGTARDENETPPPRARRRKNGKLTLGRPLERLGDVDVVDDVGLDAVAAPLDLADQAGHLVAVEGVARVVGSDVLHGGLQASGRRGEGRRGAEKERGGEREKRTGGEGSRCSLHGRRSTTRAGALSGGYPAASRWLEEGERHARACDERFFLWCQVGSDGERASGGALVLLVVGCGGREVGVSCVTGDMLCV